ncbi:MAG: methyltransferase domain-containing protein [Sedimentisphaerales bacterium]|nr:methyltransferase domain-containing protein [Sedimentisphaerales bacterium]
MIASEYERLYQAEERLWWFRAMHLFLRRLLPREHRMPGEFLALDIGCGTGGFLKKLSGAGYQTMGLEYARIALDYTRLRQDRGLVQASANDLPFESAFDLVVCVDLLEVGTVEPRKLIDAAIRALKPGGYGIFVMAAHQWLLSEHDRAVNSVRRYNLRQIRELFAKTGVEILRSSYLFFFLFPLVAIRKFFNRKRNSAESAESDVSIPPGFVNAPLYALCWLEAQLVSIFNMPLGSSVIILVRKNA